MRIPRPGSVSRMNQRNPLQRSLLACGALLLAGCAAQAPVPSDARGVAMNSSDSAVDFQKLAGTTWVAEDIDQQGVIDNLQSRLQIVSTAEVAGHGGCNSYHGPAELASATSLRFGLFATTRMMCAPAVMDQERKFLDALSRAHSARTENELLFLLDESGVAILRFSRVTR